MVRSAGAAAARAGPVNWAADFSAAASTQGRFSPKRRRGPPMSSAHDWLGPGIMRKTVEPVGGTASCGAAGFFEVSRFRATGAHLIRCQVFGFGLFSVFDRGRSRDWRICGKPSDRRGAAVMAGAAIAMAVGSGLGSGHEPPQ